MAAMSGSASAIPFGPSRRAVLRATQTLSSVIGISRSDIKTMRVMIVVVDIGLFLGRGLFHVLLAFI